MDPQFNVGLFTTPGYFSRTSLRDLVVGSSRGLGSGLGIGLQKPFLQEFSTR